MVVSDVRSPRLDAASLIERLERAGATLLAIPTCGYSTKIRTGALDYVRNAIEAYGWSDEPVRPAFPDAEAISAMDEAYSWLRFIPPDRITMRRIVGIRSLVHPITDRHLYPWRRVGRAIGADYRAVQRWHAEGIELILGEINRRARLGEKISHGGCSNGSNLWH